MRSAAHCATDDFGVQHVNGSGAPRGSGPQRRGRRMMAPRCPGPAPHPTGDRIVCGAVEWSSVSWCPGMAITPCGFGFGRAPNSFSSRPPPPMRAIGRATGSLRGESTSWAPQQSGDGEFRAQQFLAARMPSTTKTPRARELARFSPASESSLKMQDADVRWRWETITAFRIRLQSLELRGRLVMSRPRRGDRLVVIPLPCSL